MAIPLLTRPYPCLNTIHPLLKDSYSIPSHRHIHDNPDHHQDNDDLDEEYREVVVDFHFSALAHGLSIPDMAKSLVEFLSKSQVTTGLRYAKP